MLTAAQEKVFRHDVIAGLAADLARSKAVRTSVTAMAYRDPSGVDIGNMVVHEIDRYAKGSKVSILPRMRSVIARFLNPAQAGELLREYREGQFSSDTGFGQLEIGSLIGSLVTAGASIGAAFINKDTQESLLKMQQQATARQAAEQNAAAVAVAKAQAQATIAATSGGMPGWVLPVGIAAALGVGFVVFRNMR